MYVTLQMRNNVHKLITIAFSHYNEKARWALDRFGVRFHERPYMPLFHAIGVLAIAPRYGLGTPTKHSSRLATPVLVTDDDHCIRGSDAIMRYVSDRYANADSSLYPNEEAASLAYEFTFELGPYTRRIAYLHLLADEHAIGDLADANVGARQAWLFRRAQPFVKRFVGRRLGVTADRAERALQRVRQSLATVSARIRGRRYLTGDRFTAADIAFASMMAPVILP